MSDPITILIADDSVDDRLSLRGTLEAKGYSVLEASDTQETFVRADSELPDLIILDVGMPPDDGYTVCKRLKNNPRTSRIPILMLTGHGLVQEKTTGLYSGADDYVIKPCDNEELLARITVLFRRYPPRSHYYERIEDARRSIEVAESYRRHIVVLNVDVKDSSVPPSNIREEYLRQLIFRDYHAVVEEAVRNHRGSNVAWAGDGGTAEFCDAESAVSAASAILRRYAQDHSDSRITLRIGVAAGSELVEPSSEIGKRTSQTHSRAGRFQKHSNYNKVTIGKEVYESLSDKSLFQGRVPIDEEVVFETK